MVQIRNSRIHDPAHILIRKGSFQPGVYTLGLCVYTPDWLFVQGRSVKNRTHSVEICQGLPPSVCNWCVDRVCIIPYR